MHTENNLGCLEHVYGKVHVSVRTSSLSCSIHLGEENCMFRRPYRNMVAFSYFSVPGTIVVHKKWTIRGQYQNLSHDEEEAEEKKTSISLGYTLKGSVLNRGCKPLICRDSISFGLKSKCFSAFQ